MEHRKRRPYSGIVYPIVSPQRVRAFLRVGDATPQLDTALAVFTTSAACTCSDFLGIVSAERAHGIPLPFEALLLPMNPPQAHPALSPWWMPVSSLLAHPPSSGRETLSENSGNFTGRPVKPQSSHLDARRECEPAFRLALPS